MNLKNLFVVIPIFSIFLIGCRPAVTQKPAASLVAATVPATSTATLIIPTKTITLTHTSEPTWIPTATPHPMEIRALRERSYPGSPITIEQELDPGANYRRYYAYYLSDGYKIYALLTVPNGDMPVGGWPVIIFNHGYIPPDQYRTTERYVAYVDRLARAGYIVFRIDYRGHDRSEGPASGAYTSPGYLSDVLNAVNSIKQFPQANPENIGMWGHSMGGYLTLTGMVINPEIKAGVIWAGVVGSYPDLLYNWRRASGSPVPTPRPGSSRWRDAWVNTYGSPESNPNFWDSISSNTFLADLSGPVQLHHGTADEDVPVEFSQTLAGQIENIGKTVELYVYPGDNHNLSNYFTTAMNRTIDFFDDHVK